MVILQFGNAKGSTKETLNVEKRGPMARELKLCFKCLSDAHSDQMISVAYQLNLSDSLCDVNDCGKSHHRLLHRPYKNVEQTKNCWKCRCGLQLVINEKQWSAYSHSSNDKGYKSLKTVPL